MFSTMFLFSGRYVQFNNLYSLGRSKHAFFLGTLDMLGFQDILVITK